MPGETDRLPVGLTQSGEIFDGKIKLLGWMAVNKDNALEITLAWRSVTPSDEGYTALVHLLNGEGEIIGQVDRPPAGYPTTDWRPGEIVVDRFAIPWPSERPQRWGLRTGFYDSATQTPLGEPLLLSPG